MGSERKCDCPFEPAASQERREAAIAELKLRANSGKGDGISKAGGIDRGGLIDNDTQGG
ncbi:hypothetical protein ACN9MB_13165 [Dyella kyungheensis]|uniref:hypothetical protein n=1 Tax=Dyella kyungheensis TaxID=1242174 RepID=UPI003CF2619F